MFITIIVGIVVVVTNVDLLLLHKCVWTLYIWSVQQRHEQPQTCWLPCAAELWVNHIWTCFFSILSSHKHVKCHVLYLYGSYHYTRKFHQRLWAVTNMSSAIRRRCTALSVYIRVSAAMWAVTNMPSSNVMQVFGSAAHGGVSSAVRTRARSWCHHDSSHRALPHPLPRQNGAAYTEPVSLLHCHASVCGCTFGYLSVQEVAEIRCLSIYQDTIHR